MGAVNIFVSDDYGFVFGLGDNRLHRLRAEMICSESVRLSSGRAIR
jgi:hypothetical protein